MPQHGVPGMYLPLKRNLARTHSYTQFSILSWHMADKVQAVVIVVAFITIQLVQYNNLHCTSQQHNHAGWMSSCQCRIIATGQSHQLSTQHSGLSWSHGLHSSRSPVQAAMTLYLSLGFEHCQDPANPGPGAATGADSEGTQLGAGLGPSLHLSLSPTHVVQSR